MDACHSVPFQAAQFAAAGGFRDLDGDSPLEELSAVGDAHHGDSVPSLLPLSTDVSGSSSPTRFGGDDSPPPQEAFPHDFGSGPLQGSAVGGSGGFGSPFTGGLPPGPRAFSAGLPSFAGFGAPAGPRLNGLHTLSAPLNTLPQVCFYAANLLQAAHPLVLLLYLRSNAICRKRCPLVSNDARSVLSNVPDPVTADIFCPVRLQPRAVMVYGLPQGMVPVDQPGSGFLSQPVHLRDAGRAFSMPMPVTGAGVPGERHALPPWQPPTTFEDPSRRRAKRSVSDDNWP